MSFFRILLLLFLSIPVLEIYLLIKVGDSIGAFPTVVLVVLTAVAGVWLLRMQGFATLARAQQSLARGEVPASTLFEGVLLFIAGALLLTPGFFTDSIGFILLIPYSRQWVVAFALKRALQNGSFYSASGSVYTQTSQQQADVIEGEFISHDDKQ